MHKQERYANTHLLRSRASEHMTNKVFENTGLDLTAFLKLPTYLVEHILSCLRQTGESTRSDGKKLEKQLEKQDREFSNMKKYR